MRLLFLALCTVCLSGCPFFFFGGPEPVDPAVDDGGGFIVDEDAGVVDAGVRGLDKANCTWNGKKLFGRVRYVTSFPDVRVRVVTSLPKLRVKRVTSLPNDCGEWQEVDSFPDLKVQLVTALEDLDIEYVDSFPGLSP